MNEVRFNTVRDLYDAFETAEEDVGKPASDSHSLEFLRMLKRDGDWSAAISFCAYLLPRRAAVAWGCRALRKVLPREAADEDKALAFAEAWVEEPQELQRRKALALGNQSNMRVATTWLALAAGWSGGSVVPVESGHIPATAEQTARAIRGALLMARARLPSAAADGILSSWIEDGIRLAKGEPAPS
jgi:Family of unknown function (DUF6931)